MFVEATTSGERIEARRYRESTAAWESLASLSAPDPIVRLEVSWPYVYWTDTAGGWYLRAFDE